MRLSVGLTVLALLLGPGADAQRPFTLVVVPAAIQAGLDSLAAAIRADDQEHAVCVTRAVSFTADSVRYVIPLRLDSAEITGHGQAWIRFQQPGCADSLPVIHTHRTHTRANGWVTGPSGQDSALAADYQRARWQAVVTDSGKLLLYGVKP